MKSIAASAARWPHAVGERCSARAHHAGSSGHALAAGRRARRAPFPHHGEKDATRGQELSTEERLENWRACFRRASHRRGRARRQAPSREAAGRRRAKKRARLIPAHGRPRNNPLLSSPKRKQSELARLAKEIAEHDTRYYQDDAPSIPDADYDALRQRNNGHRSALSRTDSATIPRPGGRRQAGRALRQGRHARPMLSLDNAFTAEDVRDFGARVRRFLGLSAATKNWRSSPSPRSTALALAALRKGRARARRHPRRRRRGENVTANVRTIKDIPQTHARPRVPDIFEVRGESIMRHADFAAMNKRQEKAARRFRQSAQTPPPARCASSMPPSPRAALRFFAIHWGEVSELPGKTHGRICSRLKEWGFPVNPSARRCRNVDEALNSRTRRS